MTTMNRRSFLRTTGLAGAGLVLAGCGDDQTPDSSGHTSRDSGSGSGVLPTTCHAPEAHSVIAWPNAKSEGVPRSAWRS